MDSDDIESAIEYCEYRASCGFHLWSFKNKLNGDRLCVKTVVEVVVVYFSFGAGNDNGRRDIDKDNKT